MYEAAKRQQSNGLWAMKMFHDVTKVQSCNSSFTSNLEKKEESLEDVCSQEILRRKRQSFMEVASLSSFLPCRGARTVISPKD